MKINNMKFIISFLIVFMIIIKTNAQITTRYSEDLAIEMKTFAENVMMNPDSISLYISKASEYFDFEEFILNEDLKSISRIINKFKECKTEFYSMCKGEIEESHSKTLIYHTTIIYRNYCEDNAIQFFWILNNSKWELNSIEKTDFFSCYPKEIK